MLDTEDAPVPKHASPPSTDGQALGRLVDIAGQMGEVSIADEIRQLAARINEGRYFVACVGQFKRGKSTLLDALVGEPILPTGVAPVTAVPTVLRHGTTRAARVLIENEWQPIAAEDLSLYVSEESNPENAKQVAGVEVFVHSPLLASGMCLVDTPGIGSVFAGNTETTRKFMPQIDAAILVIGADPPISGEELSLIEAVAANVGDFLVVLNKVDRVSAVERAEASAFARDVLQRRLNTRVGKIYEVSALNRLRNSGDHDDWDALLADLTALAARSGQAMTRSAAERGFRLFSDSLQRSISERIRVLREPIATSERRIAALRRTLEDAEQSLRDLGVLFSAEQMRLSITLLARRKEFLRDVLPSAGRELRRECEGVTTAYGPARRREVMARAQDVARRHVLPLLDAEERQAEELYRAITQRFVNQLNGLLRQIADGASDELSHLPGSLDAEQGFRGRSHFYFHDMASVARPASPLVYGLDVLLGAIHYHRPFRTAAADFLRQLTDTNASRVQGDVEERVVESRVLLESQVRRLLREVSATAETALARAQQLLEAGNSAVENELARLNALEEEVRPAAPAP
jgi:Dynamin family